MIRYNPTALLKQIAPDRRIEKLVTRNFGVNKSILSMFDEIAFVSKSSVKAAALRAIKKYKARYQEQKASGSTASQAATAVLGDKSLLLQRVKNTVVIQIAEEIKREYRGEYFVWLPSSSSDPDPEHQLKYGQTFQIGKGEMPGDRYGCKCGMQILVRESKLDL